MNYLTPANLVTLKDFIANNAPFNTFPHTVDGAIDILPYLNAVASPNYYIWADKTSAQKIMENGFTWTLVDALTVGKARIWEWLTRFNDFSPYKVNVRQGLQDAFPVALLNAILPHLMRKAKVGEKIFATSATGPGNNGANPVGDTTNPATYGLGVDIDNNGVGEILVGNLTSADVMAAWAA